jgi:acyl dehydratase
MSALTEYADLLKGDIGVRGEPVTTEVEKGAVRKFARAIGETNPLYYDPGYAATTRFGAMIAPPTFVAVLKGTGLPPLPDPPVTFTVFLHTDDRIEQFAPIKVGDLITTAPELADVFVKTGRNGEMLFTTFAYEFTRSDGALVAKLAWTEVQRP